MPTSSLTPDNATFDVMGSTSSSLLNRLREGESEAWQRLARLYTPLVYAWCRRFHLSGEDTADVLQEVFRAVHGGLSSFRHDCAGVHQKRNAEPATVGGYHRGQ